MPYGPAMTRRTIPLLAALLLAATPVLAKPAKALRASPPLTVEVLLAQSHTAVTKGDTQLALRLAQSAIVADPARTTPYVALGDIYADAGDADYARAYYDQALGIDPSDAGALNAIAALDHSHPAATARAGQ
jgi:Flp pilus assembly protein TadD